MDSGNLLQLLSLLGLVLCSAFFSSSEASLFSLGRMRLQALLDRGHPTAKTIRDLLAKP